MGARIAESYKALSGEKSGDVDLVSKALRDSRRRNGSLVRIANHTRSNTSRSSPAGASLSHLVTVERHRDFLMSEIRHWAKLWRLISFRLAAGNFPKSMIKRLWFDRLPLVIGNIC